MFKYVLFLFFLQTVCGIDNLKNYFCNLPCKSKHTVCRRKHCGISEACGKGAEALPLNDTDREHILNVHNKYRNNLALGHDTRGGNSQAANMRTLSYSKELEFVAQCWTNTCPEITKPHDTCRVTSKFKSVGQNMHKHALLESENSRHKEHLTQAVASWYAEIELTNAGDIGRFPGKNKLSIAHFTQLVWAETTHIGCGRLSLYGNVIIYCNYGVGGNMLGQPVYLRGPPCSKCGSQSCNQQYKALCGKIESLSEDKWSPPFRMGSSRLQTSFWFVIVLTSIFCLM